MLYNPDAVKMIRRTTDPSKRSQRNPGALVGLVIGIILVHITQMSNNQTCWGVDIFWGGFIPRWRHQFHDSLA